MEQEFELIAKTFMGLEPVLAKELTQLGAKDVKTGRRMVSFTGNKETMSCQLPVTHRYQNFEAHPPLQSQKCG